MAVAPRPSPRRGCCASPTITETWPLLRRLPGWVEERLCWTEGIENHKRVFMIMQETPLPGRDSQILVSPWDTFPLGGGVYCRAPNGLMPVPTCSPTTTRPRSWRPRDGPVRRQTPQFPGGRRRAGPASLAHQNRTSKPKTANKSEKDKNKERKSE